MYRFFIFLLFCQYSLLAQDVQNANDTVAYSVDLNDFVVTAQYEPTHYKKAFHRIDIIKKEMLAKIGAVSLDQALTLSPSVRLYKDPILGTSIRMRGVSASNVAVLIDGVPVIGRNDGAIDLSQISLQNVERLEIVEGPLSNIYGSNASGGVINIITKKSQANQWSISQSNQIESIGQRNHSASIGYQIGAVNVGLNARYFKYDQYPVDSLRIIDSEVLDDGSTMSSSRYPFNPKNQKSFGGYIRFKIDEDNHMIAKYNYNDENVSDYGKVRRIQFNPYADDQFYNTTRKDASISYKGNVKDHLYINLLSSINRYDRSRNDERYFFESMKFDSLSHAVDAIRFDQIFARTDVNYTGWNNWVVGGGYNFTLESGSGDRLIDREGKDSLVTSFTESAALANIKYTGFKNLELAIGNRFIYHNKYKSANTSSLQAKYDFNSKLFLRASYAQGYRSPSLKELFLEFTDVNHNILGNVDLKPERSYEYQLAFSYNPSNKVEFSLNGYYTEISDRITLTGIGSDISFQYNNVDEYSVYGFQPSVRYAFSDFNLNSSFSLGYWATSIDHDDIPDYGRVLDMTNSLTYNWKKPQINILWNHRYIGAQPTYREQDDVSDIVSVGKYHLIDFSISKSFWKNRIHLTSGIKNLGNVQSINELNASGERHSSGRKTAVNIGRSYFVSLNLKID